MNPQRWRQVRDLFAQAVELELDRRDGFLEEACAGDPELRREVESLLAADAATDSLVDQPFFNLHPESSEPTQGDRRIGPHPVLKEIGRGGLGTVYLAERVEFKQRVALKVIKRGMDTDEVV
ncbi:MAG: serine/threonine protein kinase, partial [bacterium]|nr:serine/threonine protein kinase [bacterium]